MSTESTSAPTPDRAAAEAPSELSTAAPAATEPNAKPLDADGRERPRFLLEFPDDAPLRRLSDAFERGDFAYVRAHADAVASQAPSPAVAAAARELRRRIDPHPLVVQLLLLALGLLAFLVGWTYLAR